MIINLLNFENFLKKQPEGLNTYIGDGGVKLSGGQIQKIAIARAIYSDREILICDEITSSLDASSEKVILNILNKLNKTIIIISHKTENLYFCDKIYQVKNKNIFIAKNKKSLIHIDYLLFNSKGEPLSAITLNQRMVKIFKDRKISVNQMRHTFLTEKYSDVMKKEKEMSNDLEKMGSSMAQSKIYVKL
jgi:ABC-type multidrug transport system ATPase subunit